MTAKTGAQSMRIGPKTHLRALASPITLKCHDFGPFLSSENSRIEAGGVAGHPSNFKLTPEGNWKLIDWGVAHRPGSILESQPKRLTGT